VPRAVRARPTTRHLENICSVGGSRLRLEPEGHMSMFERGHAVSARIALFADELQQPVGVEERWKTMPDRIDNGGR
jgi:hypothetical protein